MFSVRIRIQVSFILCILSPSLPSVPIFHPYLPSLPSVPTFHPYFPSLPSIPILHPYPPSLSSLPVLPSYPRPLPQAVSHSLYSLSSFLSSWLFLSPFILPLIPPLDRLPPSPISFPSLPIFSLYLPHPTHNLPIPPLLSPLTPTSSLSSSLTPSPSYPPSLPLFLPLLSTSPTPYSLSLRYVGDAPSFPLRFCVTESGCAFELPNDPDYSKTTDGAARILILLYSDLI